MTTPLLWVVAGHNGAGKSTYIRHKIVPRLRVPVVNADDYARERWGADADAHVAEAAAWAADRRRELLDARSSFVAETVFSHPSKLEFLSDAVTAGYEAWLTWVGLETAELAVARVVDRVSLGGHPVPEDRIVGRFARVPGLLREAVTIAARAYVVDNSDPVHPLRDVVRFERGVRVWRAAALPGWVVRIGLVSG